MFHKTIKSSFHLPRGKLNDAKLHFTQTLQKLGARSWFLFQCDNTIQIHHVHITDHRFMNKLMSMLYSILDYPRYIILYLGENSRFTVDLINCTDFWSKWHYANQLPINTFYQFHQRSSAISSTRLIVNEIKRNNWWVYDSFIFHWTSLTLTPFLPPAHNWEFYANDFKSTCRIAETQTQVLWVSS